MIDVNFTTSLDFCPHKYVVHAIRVNGVQCVEVTNIYQSFEGFFTFKRRCFGLHIQTGNKLKKMGEKDRFILSHLS